ncbi:MAG TPA: ABC transporter ATP-binding protein [Methanoregulaceae archaeon]|nr:MAG: ABC transporter ATP-binding protein [Methanolinea sp.]HON81151.1 ABC transporter ATP-binding protein [Methanoregulaceae archaeon]HPD09905.1 ABC transporter ATP-binding protein [Methanoregulaceae archaeon]HRT14904.1 ABC transporter ATP-binding protein [Methanoregulaceae archaeon]HRU30481.1 ABC transporter ATP-binding protein [Methanoregulaceae archaeon]
MLVLTAVNKRFGEFTLRNVSLTIREGEYFMILGPTGAGKTILLETIAGIHMPDSGTITLSGLDITRLPPEQRGISIVYQDVMLFPHLTVFENIAFGLKEQRLSVGEIAERVSAMADLMGISSLLERLPQTLSGGEQQRAAMARALVMCPRFLLLDEPMSALDAASRMRLRQELKRIHRNTGTTMIHITHYFEDLFPLADRLAVMQDGAIVQTGTPEEIFNHPKSDFVAHFTGMENIFRGRAVRRDDEVEIDLGPIVLHAVTPFEGDVIAGIRADELILSPGPFDSTARNTFRGTVSEIQANGAFSRVVVDVGIPLCGIITRQSLFRLGLAPGQEITVIFKASAVHVFPA